MLTKVTPGRRKIFRITELKYLRRAHYISQFNQYVQKITTEYHYNISPIGIVVATKAYTIEATLTNRFNPRYTYVLIPCYIYSPCITARNHGCFTSVHHGPHTTAGAWFNIKTIFPRVDDSHVKHKENPYTGRTTPWYWGGRNLTGYHKNVKLMRGWYIN